MRLKLREPREDEGNSLEAPMGRRKDSFRPSGTRVWGGGGAVGKRTTGEAVTSGEVHVYFRARS